MPDEDRLRWDERYLKDRRYSGLDRPRPFLVEHAYLLPASGLALDVAMGLGANAGFLLERGLQVIGVDISAVAVRRAKASFPALGVFIADLYGFHLPQASFDVILNFFFLQRDLWRDYELALKPGGLLIFETLFVAELPAQHAADPCYYLQPGELAAAFPGLETLVYRESISESEHKTPRHTAALIARKPASRDEA